MRVLWIVLLIWNIFVFFLYGLDKLKAKRGTSRISEATLLWCAFVMGSVGALLGKGLFNHKTQKKKFNILLPIAFILNIVILILLIAWINGYI